MPRSRSIAIQSERARRPLAARPDLAGELDRPAKQQQFLGQCGLAGVRVRNDRKGAPAGNLVGQGGHPIGFSYCRERPSLARAALEPDAYMMGVGFLANA
jgi:hypothetical protein